MKVELLYFPGCPNVPAAREQLLLAFATLGVRPDWIEVDVTSQATPEALRGFGSPTILVDGLDVAGDLGADGSACRLYFDSERPGVPPLRAIVSALTQRGPDKSSLAVLPSILFSTLPVVACPSCWPAYAGLLSALGFSFLMEAKWLLPITAVALGVAVLGLAHSAIKRRRFGPLLLGLASALVILTTKLTDGPNELAILATLGLISSSLLNTFPPRKGRSAAACDQC